MDSQATIYLPSQRRIKQQTDFYADYFKNDELESQSNSEDEDDYSYEYNSFKPHWQNSISLTPMNYLELARVYINQKQLSIPLFPMVKFLYLSAKSIVFNSRRLIESRLFQLSMLIIIILNSIAVALKFRAYDTIFLYLYISEFAIKGVAQGFTFWKQKSYFSIKINLLDFAILVADLADYFFQLGLKFTSLRSLRILSALYQVKVMSIQIILVSLFKSLYHLKFALAVLLFTYSMFSIIGLVFFSGLLKYRCISGEFGIQVSDDICNQQVEGCQEGFICAKTLTNPQNGLINFDTFLWSLLQVFICTAMNGWSAIMFYVASATNYSVVIYFLVIVIFGGFFLVNLTLAIIKVNFSKENQCPPIQDIEVTEYDYWILRDIGVYHPPQRKADSDEEGVNLNYGQTQQSERSKRRKPKEKSVHQTVTEILPSQSRIRLPKTNCIKKPIVKSEIHYGEGFQVKKHKKVNFIGIQGLPRPFDEPPIPPLLQLQSSRSFLNSDARLLNEISGWKSQKSLLKQPSTNSLFKNGSPKSISRFFPPADSTPRSNNLALSIQVPQDRRVSTVKRKTALLTPIPKIDESNNILQISVVKQQSSFKVKAKEFKINEFDTDEEDDENNEVLEKNSPKPEEIDACLQELECQMENYQVPKRRKGGKHKSFVRKNRKNKLYRPISTSVDEERKKKLSLKFYKTQFKLLVQKIDYSSLSEFDVLEPKIKMQYLLREREKKFKIVDQKNILIYTLFEKSKSLQGSGVFQNRGYEIKYLKDSNIPIVNPQTKIVQVKPQLTYFDALQELRNDFQLVDYLVDEYGIIECDVPDKIFLTKYQQYIRSFYNYEEYYRIIDQQELIVASSIADIVYINDEAEEKLKLKIIHSLNYYEKDIWIAGLQGFLKIIKIHTTKLVVSKFFSQIINLCVATNTIVLSLDGLVKNENLLSEFNYAFTVIFTIEMSLKIIGLGTFKYLKDTFNQFDAVIVIVSILEISVIDNGSGKSTFSAFRTIRIFRALRVLRVSRLLRSLSFMGYLLKVIMNSIEKIVILFFLMLFFQYVFTLLGYDLFYNELDGKIVRMNYNSLFESYAVVFQVFTLSNWNNVLYSQLLSQSKYFIVLIYLVLWIMIGNYILLNLFLAMLLDNFEIEYRTDKKQIDTNITIAKDKVFEEDSQSSYHSRRSTKNSIQLLEIDFPAETFQYFEEVGLAEISLFLFSQENLFRRFCYKLVRHYSFEYFILLIILVSSFKLVFDTYKISSIEYYSDIVDQILVYLFLTEAILKIIAYGFRAYLRSYWNILDFFILAASICDMYIGQVDLGVVRIFRLLRTLRPMRFITHYSSMKIIVSALLQSGVGIFNVGIVIILIWIIFAILGINFTQGKLNYCNFGDGITYYISKDQCPTTWDVRDTNFDNIFSGMLTLFILSTLVSWVDYMQYFVDGTETGPVFNANPEIFWFFAAFILIGSILLINLFIGVILVNFHIAEEKSRDPFLTADHIFWINTQSLIVEMTPNFHLYYRPGTMLGDFFFGIVSNKWFEYFIMSAIFGNVIVSAIYFDDSPSYYVFILDIFNTSFSILFIVEALIKNLAFTPKGYFSDRWNQFDFLIVLSSIVDLILKFFQVNIYYTQAFKLLRTVRLIRTVNHFKGLMQVVNTAIFSIPAIANAAIVYFLFHSIFSLVAVYLFKDIQSGLVIDEYVNFRDFHHSFVILFRSQTGEDWYLVMFDTMHQGNQFNAVFWIIFIVIQEFIMLNLFILIILDQYDINYFQEDNPLLKFQISKKNFIKAWTHVSPTGEYIHHERLIDLLYLLKQPLGFDLKHTMTREIEEWKQINMNHTKAELNQLKTKIKADILKTGVMKIVNMNLLADSNGNIPFHHVFFGVMRESVILKLAESLTNRAARKIQKKEKETKKYLDKKSELNLQNEVNPIIPFLYRSLAFKAFLAYSKNMASMNDSEEIYDSDFDFQDEVIQEYNGSMTAKSDRDHNIGFTCIPNTDIYYDEHVFVSTPRHNHLDYVDFESYQ